MAIRPGHDWGPDFAVYIHHAENIVRGVDYRNTGFPILRYGEIATWTYPPVFPLLLAPVYAAFGLNLTALKMVGIVFFLLALVAIHLAFSRDLPFAYRLLLLALVGFNPYFYYFVNKIVSDIPFLFFAYLSLALMRAGDRERSAPGPPAVLGVATGLALYLAYGTRTVGAILLVCFIGHELWRQRRLTRHAVVIVLVFLPLAVLQNLMLHSDFLYGAPLLAKLGNPVQLLASVHYLTDWRKALDVSPYMLPLLLALGGATIPWMVKGYAARIRGGATVFEFFVPVYLVLLVLWPGGASTPRFLIPLIPLGVFYLLTGLRPLLSARQPRRERRLLAGLAAAAGVAYVGIFSLLERGPYGEVDDPDAMQFFRYVETRTRPTDLFVFVKPAVLTLWADRRSTWCPSAATEEEAWECLRAYDATHLVLAEWSPVDRNFWMPFVRHHPARFRLIYRNSDYGIYRVVAESADGDAPRG